MSRTFSHQREQVQRAGGGGLYSSSGRTPPKKQLSRRILSASAPTWGRIRRAVCLGLKHLCRPLHGLWGLLLERTHSWRCGLQVYRQLRWLGGCKIVQTPGDAKRRVLSPGIAVSSKPERLECLIFLHQEGSFAFVPAFE